MTLISLNHDKISLELKRIKKDPKIQQATDKKH